MHDAVNSPQANLPTDPRPPTGTVSPPGLDLSRLADYLDRSAPGIIDGPLTAEVIMGGKSNLTYLVQGPAGRVVVRRPPLGHVLPTANDMSREYKVIAALQPAGFPVPAPLHLCEDPTVIGAPFYLMSYVDGRSLLSLDDYVRIGRTNATRTGELAVDTLARLHAIVPAEVGLADLGRPEGFLERQVRRWYQQWERSKTRELPSLERLVTTLKNTVPTGSRTGIVHGDYFYHNMMVDADVTCVLAVVDWEMATLGDPLTDLGWLMACSDQPVDFQGKPISPTFGQEHGFLSQTQLAQRYADRVPEATVDDVAWYVALAYYKLAMAFEAVHARYLLGMTVGEDFDHIGDAVPLLIDRATAALTA